MQILNQSQIDSFRKFIDGHESFIIAGHKEPDGDCIASCVGISKIIEHFNKPYIMLNAGPFKRTEIKKYASLFKNELPFMAQSEREKCGFIITDCSEIQRIGEIDGDLTGLDTYIIDHHKTSDSSMPDTIIDPTSPAACCLVCQLYEALAGTPDPETAKILFFGLSTDTGYFRFLDSTSGDVFRLAARLTDAGANPRSIYDYMTSGKPWNTRKLLGLMLERATPYFNGKLIVTWETMDDTKKLGQDGRDSDALYQMLLQVDGVEAVLFIRQETDHNCTLGFRSRDKVDVSAIAAKFGGGGHKNASGGSTEGQIETLIPAIVKEFARVMG